MVARVICVPMPEVLVEQVLYQWEAQRGTTGGHMESERFQIQVYTSGTWVFHERRTKGVLDRCDMRPLKHHEELFRIEPASLPTGFRTPAINHLRRRCDHESGGLGFIDHTDETYAMVVRICAGPTRGDRGGGRWRMTLSLPGGALTDPCLDSGAWILGRPGDSSSMRPNAVPVVDSVPTGPVEVDGAGVGFSEPIRLQVQRNRVASHGTQPRLTGVEWVAGTERGVPLEKAKSCEGTKCVQFEQGVLVPEWERLKGMKHGSDPVMREAAEVVMALLGERARARWFFLEGKDLLEEPLECEGVMNTVPPTPPMDCFRHPGWRLLGRHDAAHISAFRERCTAEWRRQGIPAEAHDYLTRFVTECVDELEVMITAGMGSDLGAETFPTEILSEAPPMQGGVVLRAGWLHRQTTLRCLERLGIRPSAEVCKGLLGRKLGGMPIPYAWLETTGAPERGRR